MAYRDTVLTDTPADYYEMESLTGTDSGSGSRTATLANITSGLGNIGNGWVFNGTTAQVTMPTFPGGTAVANMSLEAWFKAPSNGGWTNDYPTFVRRDGADIILIRGRSSNFAAGNNPGKAEVYWAGSTITSLNRVDDGNWHHIVATAAGNQLKLYVDGVLQNTVTTSKTTYNLGTGSAFIGGNSGLGVEFYQGTLDNVAVYSTALSQTRVTAHYNAGVAVNVSYTAAAMTASGAAPNAVAIPVKNNSWTASAVTATASITTPVVFTLISQTPGDDYSYSNATGTITADATTLVIDADNDSVLPFSPLPTGVIIDTATLRLSGDAGTLSIYPIMASWSGKPTSRGSYTLGTPITVTQSAGLTTHNISTLLAQGTVYGFLLTTSGGGMAFPSGSNASVSDRPLLNFQYHSEIVDVVVLSGPMTASAEMTSAAVFISAAPTIATMTATASAPTAIATAQHDGGFIAEAMVADASMPGGLFTYPASYAASVATASAAMPTAAVSTTIGAKVVASAMTANAKLLAPFSVNDIVLEQNESDDPYSNRVSALKPKYWWRFNDSSSVVKDSVTGQTSGVPSAMYRNGATGNQATAPEGRKAVHFPLGGFIEQNEPSGSNVDETTYIGTNSVVRTVLEFSMKTNKANQFVMAGADQTVGANGVASTAGATEIFVQNGKLGYRTWSNQSVDSSGLNTITKEFTGFTNIADDEWHHITIRSGIKSGVRDEYGVEIWVDGKMDVRRYFTQSWIGMPDFIGARYAAFDSAVLPPLPLSQNYEGDLAELVWYADTTHVPDDITRNYYAFFGYRPMEAPAMEATATMADAKGKGNQKKALYLYWSDQDEVFGGMPGNYSPGQGSLVDNRYYTSFDPMPNMASDTYSSALRLSEETGEFFGFKVFTKSITRNYSPLGVISYRDPVTDEQSLIDLTRDIDLSDYDVIMFKDWPDESYERDWYETNYPGQMERVLQQLRDANEDGIGLYVTNPRLAIDLGIIDSVEFVEPLTEHKSVTGQGRAAGMYDYGSALKFPWNIVSSDGLTGNTFAAGIGVEMNVAPSYLAQKAYFYYDNNRNNKFRVRAKISGLTDLPSYMLEDAVWHVDADQWGWEGAAYKYLHRLNGLEIGDEYIFHGAPNIDPRWLDSTELRYLRSNGTWATPPGHVKAGTIVTTFGSKQFVGGVETTNPYQDYATTIVLESGTILNGRSTGGRIFVNFSETPSQGLGMPVQVLPGSQDALDNPLGLEPEELSVDPSTPIPLLNGTDEQNALVNEALARCSFPFYKIQNRVKSRWGYERIPVVWNMEPSSESDGVVNFDKNTGVVTINELYARDFAVANGLSYEDTVMAAVVASFGLIVDIVYLQPYQRVNIWNAYHGDWNVYHEDPVTGNNVYASDYILPQNYPIDSTTTDIHGGEGWGGASKTKNLKWAFGLGFVQAYSDIPVPSNVYMPHPSQEFIGPLIRAAIEVGPGADIFDQGQVDSEWPRGYTPETNAQREWEYSWTRTSLSFSVSALKTRTVRVTMPDGSVQNVTQGSTVGTRDDEQLTMARSNQVFPVITKPRLEMTARGIYWLAQNERPAEGDAVVRATTMDANGTTPSATSIAQRSTVVTVQSMSANATMTESMQAKSGNALVLTSPMTAEARFTQGQERTVSATPMAATGTMPDVVSKASGEAITLRLPRPARVTLRIKEAV